PEVDAAGDDRAHEGRGPQGGVEHLAPELACRLPVRQQDDQDHCMTLRMASPQDVRYDVASRRTFFSRTPSPICMPWKGSASAHGKEVWAVIASVRPARPAEPPATMM